MQNTKGIQLNYKANIKETKRGMQRESQRRTGNKGKRCAKRAGGFIMCVYVKYKVNTKADKGKRRAKRAGFFYVFYAKYKGNTKGNKGNTNVFSILQRE